MLDQSQESKQISIKINERNAWLFTEHLILIKHYADIDQWLARPRKNGNDESSFQQRLFQPKLVNSTSIQHSQVLGLEEKYHHWYWLLGAPLPRELAIRHV